MFIWEVGLLKGRIYVLYKRLNVGNNINIILFIFIGVFKYFINLYVFIFCIFFNELFYRVSMWINVLIINVIKVKNRC